MQALEQRVRTNTATLLGVQSGATLPPRTLEVLAKLDRYDWSHLQPRVQQEQGWSDGTYGTVERETKRFLSLGVLDPGQSHSPSPIVDKLWHAWILDTRTYRQFCESVFGFFVHHNPTLGGERLEGSYERTIEIYKTFYGDLLPEIWGSTEWCGSSCEPGGGGGCKNIFGSCD